MIYIEKEQASQTSEGDFTLPWWVARFPVNTWPEKVDFDGFIYRMDQFRRDSVGEVLSVTYICGDKKLVVTS
jgi:hypothetical protein